MSNTAPKPEMDERIRGHKGLGLIQMFEGHGKGKTTAALGEAIRAVGAALKVAIIYFDKGGENYNERRAMSSYLQEQIDVHPTGRDRIDEQGRFDFSITELDKQEGARGLSILQRLFKEWRHDLIVLDELNSSADLGIVDVDAAVKLIQSKPEGLELVITGRNAPEPLRTLAHLITEMKLQKHYFYSGVKAREGIDF